MNAHAGQLVVLAKDASSFYDNLSAGVALETAVPEFTVENGLHVRVNAARRIPALTTITDYCHTRLPR